MKTTIELAPFCLQTHISPLMRMDSPFVQRGWRYATNGKVCVRVKDDRKDTPGKFPIAARVFDGIEHSPKREMPLVVEEVRAKCAQCQTVIGRERVPLDLCCEECLDQLVATVVCIADGVDFDRQYWSKLMELPDIALLGSVKECTPTHFTFDDLNGGEGHAAIMPIADVDN